jgi:hypothetical protein
VKLIIYSENPDFKPIELDVVSALISPPPSVKMVHINDVGVEYSAEPDVYSFWDPDNKFIGWIRAMSIPERLAKSLAKLRFTK